MDWPVAVVACSGVLFLAVVVWAVMAVGRTAVVQEAQKEIALQVKKDTAELLDEVRGTLRELSVGQREVTEGVTDLRGRIAAIEKLLREVD
jgi:hypothetical protein